MNSAASSPARFAPRSRAFLALSIALAIALVSMLLLWADPSHARASKPDTRSPVEIHAALDEPQWAFVDNPVEVFISFGVPRDEPRQPTGTLTLQVNERGAVPETRTLTGDEGDVRIYITPVKTGTRQYTVTYFGDAFFQPAEKKFSYEVLTGRLTKTTIRASTKGPITVSEPVKLTAQVTATDGRKLSGLSDGPIVFYSDGKFIGEGTVTPGSSGWSATLTVEYLPIGIHSLTARHESAIRYSGPESDPVFLRVLPPADPLPLDAEHIVSQTGPYGVHMEVTLSPQLAGSPTPVGYVQFYSDGIEFALPVKVVEGKASIDHWLPTSPRTFTYSAEYLGDPRYAPIQFPGQTLTFPLP